MPPELKPYQVEGIQWLKEHPRTLLADEAGLGKSVQLLRAAVEPVLIVAPAMILEAGTWDDEIEKWAPGIDATQVAYTSLAVRGERGRVERDANGFPLTPPKPAYGMPHWGTVILDESHYVKGRKCSYANAVQQLKADAVRNATGTPIPNWAKEAFMLLRVLYPDEAKAGREYGSFWRWAKKWFEVEENRWGAREVGDLLDNSDEGWAEFRAENWGDLMLRRLRKDVLQDLPPLTEQIHRTPMGREQRKAYNELKRDFVAWLDTGKEISVWSEPGLLVKLAKLTTGVEILDPRHKPTGKLKVLEQLIEDRPGEQQFVVAHFRDSVDACAATARRMSKKAMIVRGGMPVAERAQAVRAFQRGEIDVLAASVNTIAEGITLHQAGCHHVIRVERSATPSKNDQVIRRLHRIGQEEPVLCTDLVTPNSYDENILAMLRVKTDEQMKALGDHELRQLA